MSYKFLVVDNEPNLIEALLTEDYPGCEVHALTSPEEAIDYCKANVYDIIYTDFNMPQMSGNDFIQGVRELENDNINTGVIVLSDNLDHATLAPHNLKNAFVLEKPLNRDLNKHKVRILLTLKS
jgi:CheY-like chemotaxis protein